jgi:steroid 5-alpha reductase family enzyme
MAIWGIVALTQLLMFGWMAALYLYEEKKQNAGIVDFGWTAGMGLAALIYFVSVDGWWPRKLLVTAMVCAWSARLAFYVLFDRVLGKPEDSRYRDLRAHWEGDASRKFLFFFEAQAVLIVLFSLPPLVVMRHPEASFRGWDALGLLVWLVAVAGESMADRQLARFRSDPANRGRTCRSGLWRSSRHPNYFFEWVHWWAYLVMAVGAPAGWLTVLGPVLMFVFLYKVTGIPYAERRALASRGADYREYQRTTSAFFPWFPKKGHHAE